MSAKLTLYVVLHVHHFEASIRHLNQVSIILTYLRHLSESVNNKTMIL